MCYCLDELNNPLHSLTVFYENGKPLQSCLDAIEHQKRFLKHLCSCSKPSLTWTWNWNQPRQSESHIQISPSLSPSHCTHTCSESKPELRTFINLFEDDKFSESDNMSDVTSDSDDINMQVSSDSDNLNTGNRLTVHSQPEILVPDTQGMCSTNFSFFSYVDSYLF